MKKRFKILYLVFCLVLFNVSISQERKEVKANELFDSYAYIDAVSIYQKIIDKGYLSVNTLKKAGDAYYFNGKFNEANAFYSMLFETTNEPLSVEYYYRFSQCLKSKGEYKKSDSIMLIYNDKNRNLLIKQNFLNQQNYLDLIKLNSNRYTIDQVKINTPHSEYGTSYFGDKLVYVSNKKNSFYSKKIDTWTNDNFSKLYMVDLDPYGRIVTSTNSKFPKSIESKYHLSSVSFSIQNNIMYFTANGEFKANNHDSKKLQLYRSFFDGEQWSEPEGVPFNSPNYNVAHPSLNKEGNKLFFVSDMPGGYGQSDIYVVEVFPNGSFGSVMNLGNNINTEGKETFPFITNDELYFSSDGFPGLGGLDVYVAKKSVLGTYIRPYNLGEPINSPYDDFTFIINPENRTGYVSSNREGGKGSDDIYKIFEKKPLKLFTNVMVEGKVLDKDDNIAIPNVLVYIYDSQFNHLKSVETNNNGEFMVELDNFSQYFLRTEKEKYLTTEQQLNLDVIDESKKMDTIFLEKRLKKISVGDDLAGYLEIQNIYFDFDKYAISSQSYVELQKVIEYLKVNKEIIIDIRTHTDTRGSDKYNMALSQKRFEAIYDYFIKNGVSKSQLSGKGYGETKPLNNCINVSECSEVEHLLNRRCEFIITEITNK